MPISRSAEISRRIARLVDSEPLGIAESISPELVGVIIAGDIKPTQRQGVGGGTIGAGAVATRSEISMALVNGRIGSDEIVLVTEIGVMFTSTNNIEIILGAPLATPGSTSMVGYGDRLYGAVAPVNVNTKNSAAATAGGINFLGSNIELPANVWTILPVSITLRDAVFYPRGAADILVRAIADQVAVKAWFAWRVLPDVR